MRTVELQLFEWRRLYSDLTDAERRLRRARALDVAGSEMTVELETRVDRLRQESDGALEAIHMAIAARRSHHEAQPSV